MSSATKPPEPPWQRATRSLAFRINAWYAGVFLLSFLALGAIAIPFGVHSLRAADSLVLENRVERHVAVLSSGLPAYQNAVEGSAALGEGQAPVRVARLDGGTLYQYGTFHTARFTTERITGDLRLELGAPQNSPSHLAAQHLAPIAGMLGMGALLLSVAGGLALTRRGLRPVRELTATAHDVIRSGDLSRRVPERGTGDELDELSRLFNRMLSRNQTLVGGMREALDNVAHDLRTPLTRLRGTAEVALRSDDVPSAREALAVCIEESDRVLVMLKSLMEVSEAESGLLRLERSQVSLKQLSSEVIELYEQVAEDAGVALGFSGEEDVMVSADRSRLRQAVANLVDNAIKYTPRGGRVSLQVGRSAEDAVLRVEDTGEGIGADALPRIFDRLFRAEPSRSKPGLGLGLSLVKAIAEAHGGHVTVSSSVGKGSCFSLTLPAT